MPFGTVPWSKLFFRHPPHPSPQPAVTGRAVQHVSTECHGQTAPTNRDGPHLMSLRQELERPSLQWQQQRQ